MAASGDMYTVLSNLSGSRYFARADKSKVKVCPASLSIATIVTSVACYRGRGREGWREGGKEGGREGRREGGREGGRGERGEGGRYSYCLLINADWLFSMHIQHFLHTLRILKSDEAKPPAINYTLIKPYTLHAMSRKHYYAYNIHKYYTHIRTAL